MKKFNKFDLVYESALRELIGEENAIDSKEYSNGLKIGSCIRLKPSFFTQSEAAKSMDEAQLNALKGINDTEYDRCKHYFKVKTDSRSQVGPNVKSANDVNSLNVEYGVVSGAEQNNDMYKFIVPAKDIKHLEICSFSGNLPPVLSPKNAYSFHDAEKGNPVQVDDTAFTGLGNSPVNRSLPTQNTKL